MMWTFDSAIYIVRLLNQANLHWNFALGGGVLNKGYSDHDLDLLCFPHDASDTQLHKLYQTLGHMGWVRTHTPEDMIKSWRSKGSRDTKHVEVWKTADGKRVDIIVVK